jgi:hypothetical protein
MPSSAALLRPGTVSTRAGGQSLAALPSQFYDWDCPRCLAQQGGFAAPGDEGLAFG